MAELFKNKVVFGNDVLIDLTNDNVTAADVTSGKTFHLATGERVEGISTKDSDTSDATALDSNLVAGATAYARGQKLTGTMPNNGEVHGIISTKEGIYNIPAGYHDGGGDVIIAESEQAKIIPENIRENVTILGVDGTMSGSESENPQDNKDVTPTKTQQIISPDDGYTCLRQVTVKAIPYSEVENAAGGLTATIG